MSGQSEPLPIRHVGDDGMGSDVYLLDGDLEIYMGPGGEITASGVVRRELRRRGIQWEDVLASVIWTQVCEHQCRLAGEL